MSAALAKLQIARKELGLDEPTYRAMLHRLTGQESAKGLDEVQIGRVLDEMKAKGWKPKPAARAAGRAPKGRAADHPVARKARALWISLYELGEVADPSEAALEAFARRQLRCDRLQWSDQGLSYKLIEALKAWARRAGWEQRPGADVRELREGLVAALAKRLLALGGQVPARDADFSLFTDLELDTVRIAMGVAIREIMAARA